MVAATSTTFIFAMMVVDFHDVCPCGGGTVFHSASGYLFSLFLAGSPCDALPPPYRSLISLPASPTAPPYHSEGGKVAAGYQRCPPDACSSSEFRPCVKESVAAADSLSTTYPDQFIMMNDDSYHWPSIEEGENAIFGVSSASPLKAALSKPPLLQMPELMQNPTSKSDGAKLITCSKCGRQYKLKSSLLNHQRWECGKEPQFKCVLCNYKAKQKVHLVTHMRYKHALKPDVFSLK
ncbi:hypothetical protein V9T40_010905 [Parthenolecanium corni]|uniref:C2H2-type domain-containing protein n=1 Tax=Parthenolecanium corni TaxID=536013 RepID=A0AAN9T7Z6_9HEMI